MEIKTETGPMQDLFDVLPHIPALAGIERRDLDIVQLAGLTNTNYKVSGPDICVVVRLHGAGSETYVSRECEARNAQNALRAGVSPEILHHDGQLGFMVTRFVDGAGPLNPDSAASPPMLRRIAKTLEKLHTRSDRFANDFDPFGQLDRYFSILNASGHEPPVEFLGLASQLNALRKAIAVHAGDTRPCHCDLLPENILDDGTRLFIIDYEFSGNYHPLWDLGDFSGEANLSSPQDDILLNSYFGGPFSIQIRGLFVIFKAISLLLAAGWAQVQIVNGNPFENFEAYTETRLARCADIVESEEFRRHRGLVIEKLSCSNYADGYDQNTAAVRYVCEPPVKHWA